MKQWLLFLLLPLVGCANKDWYIHLKARVEMPVEVTIGRGNTSTVQKVTEEDNYQ